MSQLLQRFNASDASGDRDAPAELPIRIGSRADYLALKAHHYRSGHPMTTMRVLAIDERSPTAADRYLSRPPTPRPIAVLVESLPALSCRLRESALGGRYEHLRPRQRSAMLNQELRCISRVIIDPRWRGLGLAVRLVRHALATATTRYTEALAVMGRVSPFFERAGMIAYQRPPLPVDERALAVMRFAGLDPITLAMPDALAQQIESLPVAARELLACELGRWYRTAGGRGVSRRPEMIDILRAARQRLLAQPIYYMHENTDDQSDNGLA